MNLLLLGPQGSGKGTQGRLLCDKFGFFYFESGEYLRKVAKENADLEKMLAEGVLVPDREMTSFLTAFLDQHNLYDDIIFDGFPRTLGQYNFLKEWLTDKEVKLDLVIILQISEQETLRRLTARRMDPATGQIYNLVTEKIPENVDKSKLIQREDDKPEAIKKRLELYRRETEPLIVKLKEETKVVETDGERPVEEIAGDLRKIIENFKSGN